MQSLFGQLVCALCFVEQINDIFMQPLYEAVICAIANKDWYVATYYNVVILLSKLLKAEKEHKSMERARLNLDFWSIY